MLFFAICCTRICPLPFDWLSKNTLASRFCYYDVIRGSLGARSPPPPLFLIHSQANQVVRTRWYSGIKVPWLRHSVSPAPHLTPTCPLMFRIATFAYSCKSIFRLCWFPFHDGNRKPSSSVRRFLWCTMIREIFQNMFSKEMQNPFSDSFSLGFSCRNAPLPSVYCVVFAGNSLLKFVRNHNTCNTCMTIGDRQSFTFSLRMDHDYRDCYDVNFACVFVTSK